MVTLCQSQFNGDVKYGRESQTMLRDRRFLALLFVSFLISFLNAPRYALLPVYVEADLARSPLFAAGLRSTFLILGGVIAGGLGLAPSTNTNPERTFPSMFEPVHPLLCGRAQE